MGVLPCWTVSEMSTVWLSIQLSSLGSHPSGLVRIAIPRSSKDLEFIVGVLIAGSSDTISPRYEH